MTAKKPWWSFLLRRPMHLVLDALLLTFAFAAAYTLRFELDVPMAWQKRAVAQAPFVVGVELVSLWACGVYTFIWRYVGMREVSAFVRAGAFWTIPIVVIRFLPFNHVEFLRLPVSIIAMDAVFAFVGVLGLRVLRRSLHERFERTSSSRDGRKKPVLLIGAGKAGTLAAGRSSVARTRTSTSKASSTTTREDGSVIHGVKVLADTQKLPKLVRELGIDHVIITIAKASRAEMRRILDICESARQGPRHSRARGAPLRERLGQPHPQRRGGGPAGARARRARARADAALPHGRVVMVTGAGGSIGSELAARRCATGPRRWCSSSRPKMRSSSSTGSFARRGRRAISSRGADFGDEARIAGIFAEHRPEVVFHAAAHKHVPMMEQNPGEAVKNNVLGTRTLARIAGDGVGRS